jgi:hypothetical protein
LDESHKLDPQLLDENPRPKSGKFEAKPTWHHFDVKNQFIFSLHPLIFMIRVKFQMGNIDTWRTYILSLK